MKTDKISIRFILSLFFLGPSLLILSCEKEKNQVIYNQIVTEIKGWKPLFLNVVEDLNDIYFINDNSGWVVGENQILIATASGDLGWDIAPVSFPLENLRSVFFVDDQVGWIAGDLSGNPIMGQVGFTTNGGGYPVQQGAFDEPLFTVFFIDRMTGWSAGLHGLMIHTMDGGNNWTVVTPFTNFPIYDLYFNADGSGWAVAGAGGIYHTKDGQIWETESTGVDTDIFSISMVDGIVGWACGKRNTILKRELTGDETGTWSRITIHSLPASQIWNDIFFIDSSTGWVVGELGQIYITTDGGESWENEESNVTADLNAIYMVRPDRGWIVGSDGIILSYNR
jgi:photosystem II stability/assembly factor-like uncharacterized protein